MKWLDAKERIISASVVHGDQYAELSAHRRPAIIDTLVDSGQKEMA
jgi:hypothetical protein